MAGLEQVGRINLPFFIFLSFAPRARGLCSRKTGANNPANNPENHLGFYSANFPPRSHMNHALIWFIEPGRTCNSHAMRGCTGPGALIIDFSRSFFIKMIPHMGKHGPQFLNQIRAIIIDRERRTRSCKVHDPT